MKKIVVLLIVLAAGIVSLNAQEPGRVTISAGQLKNISFGDHMKIVLMSAGSMQNEVKGDMNAFEKLNISVFNGSMNIHSGKDLSSNETVYVIVNDLETITVGQHTRVETEGFLRSDEIKVFVQDGSVVRLRTTGEVNAYSLDDLEFTVKKTPVRLLASAKNALAF
ncbi:MAG TPA: DUF2807 domain-containing protein [Chitinophagaceae bacterium]|nr:DUF2807 domain-containing protein [Chitinophagaceae bacterium]